MLKDLVKVANRLDSLGLTREADIIDSYLAKKANMSSVSANSTPQKVLKDPAEILGVNNVGDVQTRLTAFQNALDNPKDLTFGENKDQLAIKAYRSLMLVLGQAIVETPIAEQLADVRTAAADWIKWATKDGATMTDSNRIIYDFLTAAAGKLGANQPVFSFQSSSQSPAATRGGNSPDAKWQKYLDGDNKRSGVWNAWFNSRRAAGLNSPSDLSFDSFITWWKSNKKNRKFNDGNVGGIAATEAILEKERAETVTRLDKERSTNPDKKEAT
jgi:hypothetical protein